MGEGKGVRMNLFYQILLYAVIFYGLCVVIMFWRQDSFMFFPVASRHQNHEYKNVVDYSLVRQTATIRGWLVNPKLVTDRVVIYYGGNGEDVFDNIDDFSALQMASLFMAYRGYGPSGGKPGEREFFADALAVIDDIVKKYSPAKIILIGRSLGSGVACFVAAHRKVQGLVLVTPFDSMVKIARSRYPWLPVNFLLRHRFNSEQYVGDIQCPVLVIYGGKDTIVEPVRTENLVRAFAREVEVFRLDRAEHNNIGMFPEYWSLLLPFMDRL